MLSDHKRSKFELAGQHKLIDDWLNARQELLTAYIGLLGMKQSKQRILPDPEKLHQFCQLLIDYVSAGHFELYRYVAKAFEKAGGKSLKVANHIYPHIQATTMFALFFSDKYSSIDADKLEQMDPIADLNELGPILEERFRLEDRLARVLHLYEQLQDTP